MQKTWFYAAALLMTAYGCDDDDDNAADANSNDAQIADSGSSNDAQTTDAAVTDASSDGEPEDAAVNDASSDGEPEDAAVNDASSDGEPEDSALSDASTDGEPEDAGEDAELDASIDGAVDDRSQCQGARQQNNKVIVPGESCAEALVLEKNGIGHYEWSDARFDRCFSDTWDPDEDCFTYFEPLSDASTIYFAFDLEEGDVLEAEWSHFADAVAYFIAGDCEEGVCDENIGIESDGLDLYVESDGRYYFIFKGIPDASGTPSIYFTPL